MATKHVEQKELSTNNYIAVVALVSLVIFLISAFFAYKLVGKIILDSKVIQKKIAANSAVKEKLDNANELVDNYNSMGSQRVDLINHSMPPSADMAQIISILENLGNAAGVTVRSVTPPSELLSAATTGAASTSAQGLQKYVYQTKVQGEYTHVIAAIKNIELSARPFKVTAVQMQGATSDLSSDFTIETYWQPPADISDKTEVLK